MKKHLFILLILLSFLSNTKAQEGIFAIARYDTTGPTKLRYDDSLTEFSGGFDAFRNVFLKEFKLPTKSFRVEKAPDGMVGFTVNLVGKIVDIEIIDSVTPEIDAEVVLVLSEISEFHPQPKSLKFAIQYNVYPDWFRDYVLEKEQTERYRIEAARTDSLLKSKKVSELEKYVDNSKVYVSGDIWAGFSTLNDPLSKFVKPTGVFGADLNFHKRKWFLGGSLQFRNSRIKQEFGYLDAFWAKDTSVSLLSMSLVGGYKLIEEERLAFTPFVGIGFGALSLPSQEDYISPDGSSIASFAPTIGFFADYKYKVKAKRMMFQSKLNTSTIRLRLAVSPMNFKEGRRGNVVDLGIGLGFSQQPLKME